MTRALVSEEQLMQLLNEALSREAACAGCSVTSAVQRLTESYPDGGNWSRSVMLRGRPADPQACGEAAADVVGSVAERYNLA